MRPGNEPVPELARNLACPGGHETTPKVGLDLFPWVKLLIKHVLCFSSQTHTPEINMSPPSPGSPPNGKQNLCIVNLGTQKLWFLLKRKKLTFTALHVFLKISVWVPCCFPSSWLKNKLTLARFTLEKSVNDITHSTPLLRGNMQSSLEFLRHSFRTKLLAFMPH